MVKPDRAGVAGSFVGGGDPSCAMEYTMIEARESKDYVSFGN